MERINRRPEIGRALQEFAQLLELFNDVQNDPKLSQLIAGAIVGALNKIDLEAEELTLVQRQPLPRKEYNLPPRPTRRLPDPATLPNRTTPPTENKPRITNGVTGYFLCSFSEERLIRSLEDTGVVLVNGFLLAKMIGKISALALETKEGFVAGHWYAPRAPWMRDSIRQAFDQGLSRVTLHNDVWDYMREAKAGYLTQSTRHDIFSTQALVDFSKQVVSHLPDQLETQIKDVPRKEYRLQH